MSAQRLTGTSSISSSTTASEPSKSLLKTSRPSMGLSMRSDAASLYFWYSMSLFTSSARGVGLVLLDDGLRKEHPRFNQAELGRDDEVFTDDLKVDVLHEFEVLDVLLRDYGDRDVVDVYFVFLYEVKQEVERALEELYLYEARLMGLHRFGFVSGVSVHFSNALIIPQSVP